MYRALAVLCLLASTNSVAANPSDTLFGRWEGTLSENMGSVELTLTKADDGFSFEVFSPAINLQPMQFKPSDKANVYEQVQETGVLSWLNFGGSTSALEGKPLGWARTGSDGSLVIYHFALGADGDFMLSRFAMSDLDGEVSAAFTSMDGAHAAAPITAQLEERR